MKNKIVPILLLTWLLILLTLFYIVQKPDFLSISAGIGNFLLTILIPTWMILLSLNIGSYFMPDCDSIERVIFSSAIGMGIFGLAGFGLAISGWANQTTFLLIFIILTAYFGYTRKLESVWVDLRQTVISIKESAKTIPAWIPIAVGTSIGLAFLMGLAPPIEDFDAMLYHLYVPELWLRGGGLFLSKAVGYWVPHIVEGSFVFPLVFGVDSAAHLIHLFWLVLTMLLVWHWAGKISNTSTSWHAVVIMLGMPSLLWLASWAYNDFTLAFTGTAVIYSVWRWRETKNIRWAVIGGIMAGLAMGAKYQSFFMPVIGALLILIWERGTFIQRIRTSAIFSAATILFAFPWYLRNWLWTGNPVYPFVFGGRGWDSFLSSFQPGISGTGIGYNLPKILLLPFTTMLGTQDANFFDGRFGPFFLILFPIAVWSFFKVKDDKGRSALVIIYLLSLTGIASWTLGVINIQGLFQSRYLFPSLIPLTIPLAMGLNALQEFDTPRLKISFIFRTILAITVFINLFNFSLQTILRDPLSVALGMTSRQSYMESRQQGYTQALELIASIPNEASVYFLFEPRAYGMQADVVPDSVLANFEHDLYIHGTYEKAFDAWKAEGYEYVLISQTGADFALENKPEIRSQLEQIIGLMREVGETRDGDYILYRIP